MKQLSVALLTLASVLSLSAQAEIFVRCDTIRGGQVASTCETSVSIPEGKGAVILADKASYLLSSDTKCDLGDYDFQVTNVTRPMPEMLGDRKLDPSLRGYSGFPESFEVSIINYKKGNRNKPKRKSRDTVSDLPFGKVGIALGYSANGNGLNCSAKNHL